MPVKMQIMTYKFTSMMLVKWCLNPGYTALATGSDGQSSMSSSSIILAAACRTKPRIVLCTRSCLNSTLELTDLFMASDKVIWEPVVVLVLTTPESRFPVPEYNDPRNCWTESLLAFCSDTPTAFRFHCTLLAMAFRGPTAASSLRSPRAERPLRSAICSAVNSFTAAAQAVRNT